MQNTHKLCYRRKYSNVYGVWYGNDFLCLENNQELYNNVLDLCKHIITYEIKINNVHDFSCQEGDLLFFGDNFHINEKLKQVLFHCKIIIVLILHNSHFALAYINKASNMCSYPIGNEEATLAHEILTYYYLHCYTINEMEKHMLSDVQWVVNHYKE
uniref:Uncharacterized protein n=1 Tax=Glossina palpalis gambiensis TaxID=67801 RepID=A0A1B0C508_9MUSC